MTAFEATVKYLCEFAARENVELDTIPAVVASERFERVFPNGDRICKISKSYFVHPIQRIRLRNLHNGLPTRKGGREYIRGLCCKANKVVK